jgi:flagellar biosynthesis protein FlhA
MATARSIFASLPRLSRDGMGAPVLLLLIMAMVILPLPPVLLDLAFTFNIFLALVVLLVAVYTPRPLDFAAFPTVLLVATLLRLALNVASTRVVLINGHDGPASAGRVIEAFGDFVIGGNYAVGLIVFSILVIINFIVVTKGSTRVSEVSARFTLDAMPGKQMAIDADLNAGLIDADSARTRRAEIIREADFYGSMDGASKFVRGDAIAAILILFINIFGGLLVGTMQHDLGIGDAAASYTLLTVGDGLVAQIPALVLATAAGIIVTRVTAAEDMGTEVIRQLFAKPKALGVTAAIIGFLGLIPGMPGFAFLSLGGIGGYLAYRQWKRLSAPEQADPVAPAITPPVSQEVGWDDVPALDTIGLEVGYRLIPLVDNSQGGELLARIKGVRKKLSKELGFLIPAVHVRDNLDLDASTYRITLRGVAVGEAELVMGRELAIDPGGGTGALNGARVTDPVFGMESVWIEAAERTHAESMGYTVVDASTVIATHLNKLLVEHAHEVLGHDEVQHLLERLAQATPKLVEDLVPKVLPLHLLVRVAQNLLRDGVPITDMRTVVETLAEHAQTISDPGILTARVRVALGRLIVQRICGNADEINVITLDPNLEQILRDANRLADESGMNLEPGLAEKLQTALLHAREGREQAGDPPVMVVPATLWPALSVFARRAARGLHVLSLDELPDDKRIRIVATVGR